MSATLFHRSWASLRFMERVYSMTSYNESMEADLPPYSSALPFGERSLDSVPSAGQVYVSSRASVKRSRGNYTVTLDNRSDVPAYGTASIISGTIHFHKLESVPEIVLKLTGKMELLIAGAGNTQVPLLSESYPVSTVWDSPSPPVVSFSIPMRNEYFPCGSTTAQYLPPTLEVSAARLYAKVSYKLSIHVSRTSRLRGLYARTKSIDIPFTYIPRLRPSRPIIDCPNFLETVKTAPEEWCQVASEIEGKDPSRPLRISVFLPMTKIYSLSDSIPFHIQLTGSHSDTAEFLPPSYSSTPSHVALPTSSQRRASTSNVPKITVYLVRQMIVEVQDLRGSKDMTIGEGELLPPETTRITSRYGLHEIVVDWMGLIRADADVSYGSFSAGELAMKDFVVVKVAPSCKSTFKELRIPIPIRLVTDSVQPR